MFNFRDAFDGHDVHYRFLGRELILLDTAANVILDRIPCAIQCTDWHGLMN